MSETIDYAEMLEIPVSTLNVVKKKGRKKKEEDLKEKAVDAVNARLGGRDDAFAAEEAPEYGRAAVSEDVTDYASEAQPPKKKFFDHPALIAECVLACALLAAILVTNIFMPNSAINTFFAGLAGGEPAAAQEDERTYFELTPGSVAPSGVECTVEDGVLTFTGECSVYAPYGGRVESVSESGGAYTVEIEHTASFSSVISGLTAAYWAAGETVYETIPVGYSDGEGEVSVRMYDGGSLIRSYTVGEENDIVWNV